MDTHMNEPAHWHPPEIILTPLPLSPILPDVPNFTDNDNDESLREHNNNHNHNNNREHKNNITS